MCIKSFYLPEDHSSYTHKIISRKDQLLYNHKKGENYWNTSVFQDFIIDNNLKKKNLNRDCYDIVSTFYDKSHINEINDKSIHKMISHPSSLCESLFLFKDALS